MDNKENHDTLSLEPSLVARTHFLSQQWSFPQTVREVASSRTGKHAAAPQPQLPRLTRLSNSLSSGNVRTSSTLVAAASQNSSNWLRQGVTPSPLQQQPGVIGRDAGTQTLTPKCPQNYFINIFGDDIFEAQKVTSRLSRVAYTQVAAKFGLNYLYLYSH